MLELLKYYCTYRICSHCNCFQLLHSLTVPHRSTLHQEAHARPSPFVPPLSQAPSFFSNIYYLPLFIFNYFPILSLKFTKFYCTLIDIILNSMFSPFFIFCCSIFLLSDLPISKTISSLSVRKLLARTKTLINYIKLFNCTVFLQIRIFSIFFLLVNLLSKTIFITVEQEEK